MAGSSSPLSSAYALSRCKAPQAKTARSMITAGTGTVPPKPDGLPDATRQTYSAGLLPGLRPGAGFGI